jgi:transcriptional regulator with XRE-family HTH domain
VVGGRVRERREELGWSQAQLTARLAYVTNGAWNPAVQEVTHIETGKRTVIDLEFIAFAQALECTSSWLLTGKYGEQRAPDTYGAEGAQTFSPGNASDSTKG